MDLELNEEFSLNWKNHMCDVREAFDHLLTFNELTDVTLCCEGRKIGAHKILLSACSSFFRETFLASPCQHPVIILFGIEFRVLSDILHFIYNGEIKIDSSRLNSFLKVAQDLQVKGLEKDKILQNQNEKFNPYQVFSNEEAVFKETDNDNDSTKTDSTHSTRTKAPKRTHEAKDIAIKEKVQKQENDAIPVSVKSESLEINYGNEGSETQPPIELDSYDNDTSELLDFEDSLQDPLRFDDNDLDNDSGEFHLDDVKDSTARHYEAVYERFLKWCDHNKIDATLIDQNVLLQYFHFLAETRKPSSLLAQYSMLKIVIKAKKNIDITNYYQLADYLKVQSRGYKPKPAKMFTRQEVAKFLNEADDDHYLMMKVALIIGLRGSCLRDELAYLRTENVIDEGNIIRILVPNTKTKIHREFFITSGDIPGINMVEILKKYTALRPKFVNHRRFFLSYKNGKCSRLPAGVNSLGAIPRMIASFLKLPNPKEYSSGCFRKSTYSLLSIL